MDMNTLTTILLSGPAYVLYVTTAFYVLHRIAEAKKLDDSKWEGLIHSAILLANESGIAPHEPGWLAAATSAFEKVYAKDNGAPPSTQDLKDAATDLASTVGPFVIPVLTGLAGKVLGGSAPAPAAPPAAPPKP